MTSPDQLIKTRIIMANSAGVAEEAAAILRAGELVVFPTDTLYGVAADAHNPDALIRLYDAKKRPFSKGLPVLIAELDYLNEIVAELPQELFALIDCYWPGPLTLVLPKQPHLPKALSPNDGVAVRIPDSEIARSIIAAAGGALAVSSANITGRPPSSSALQAYQALEGRVSMIVDAGSVPIGRASTVIDCLNPIPRLVRSGPVSVDQIEEFVAIVS